MKHNASFIFKGLVSLVLSLILVFGTAVTSLSAVTGDIAEVGAGDNMVTLYFTNGFGWTNVSAYAFSSSDVSIKNSEWPGDAMVYVGTNDYHQAIYSIMINNSLYDTVIFNGNNGGNQTPNLSVATIVSNGYGVSPKSEVNEFNNNLVEYYIFNDESSSGTGSGSTPELKKENHILLDNNGNETTYTLEYEENVGWRVKNSGGSYLTGKNANSGNDRMHDYEAKSNAIILTESYDSGTNSFVFEGYQNDARGNRQHWYLAWFAEAKEAWLYKSSQAVSVEYIQDAIETKTYTVSVTQSVTSDYTSYVSSANAGKVDYSYGTTSGSIVTASGSITKIENGTSVTLTSVPYDGYVFVGWYTDGGWISADSTYTAEILGNNIELEARYSNSPITGTYKFTYDRRDIDAADGNTTWTKTVTRSLVGAEIDGYDGNGNTPGMPTYLYTSRAKVLFGTSPVLTASLTVQGNLIDEENVSTYKNDITWPDMAVTALTEGCGIGIDTNTKTVTVTADTTPMTYTFKYKINNGDVTEGAANVKYGQVVTFNPLYKDSTSYKYVNYVVPEENFSYWSSDPEGKNILTTNRTFGMLLRGGTAVWDEQNKVYVVTAYAQYNKTISDDDMAKWFPEIEEAKLTRTIADDEDSFYADYMTNYFNYRGDVIQDMIADGTSVTYGLLVMKSTDSVSDQTKMKRVLDLMVNSNVKAAKIGDANHIAYRYEFSDAAHISNFNRALYTIKSNTEDLKGKKLSAMAYIKVDNGEYFCSVVNTDLDASDVN